MFEWLLDYQKLKEEIRYLELRIEKEKKALGRYIYGDLGGKILHENSISSGLEERIEDMIYMMAWKMNDVLDIERLVNTFEGVENRIVYLKYVEGMSIPDIADELGYTVGHVYNKHAEIRRKMDYYKSRLKL